MLDFFKIVEGKIFIIPDYQREYSWDKPQWEAFFKDISQIKDQQHLMGSILTSKYKKELPLKERERFPCYDEKTECVEFIEDDGTALHFYELIDGQQRLTTMLICLSAIKCRLLADENQKYTSIIAKIEKALHTNIRAQGGLHQVLKVNPIIFCREDFKNLIERSHTTLRNKKRSGKRKSILLMNKAFEFFYDGLSSADAAEEFYIKLTTRVKFWFQDLESAEQANIIFECQNNRGTPLTNLDKVKNNLIYRLSLVRDCPEKDQVLESVNQVWSSIFKTLADRNIYDTNVENEILVDAITLIYKEGITQNESFQYLSKKLDEESEAAGAKNILDIVRSFVTKLGDIAKFHIKFSCPISSDGSYVLPLVELKLTYAENFRPLLIACMLCAPDSQELLEVFETARDAAFWVYGASARRTNYKTSTHDRTARSIYTQNALMSSAVEYLKDFISSGIDRKRIAFDRVPESLIYAYELKDKNNEDRLKFLVSHGYTRIYKEDDYAKLPAVQEIMQERERKEKLTDLYERASNYIPSPKPTAKVGKREYLSEAAVRKSMGEALKQKDLSSLNTYSDHLETAAKKYFRAGLYGLKG